MARQDYKDASRSRPEGGGRKRGGALKGLLWGILLGLVVAAALIWLFFPRTGDFRTVTPAPDLQPPPVAIVTPQAPEPAPPPAEAKAGENPNYTFYEILPGNQTPRPQPPAKAGEVWWLQVAALKSEADANALKAKLILLGLDVTVRETMAGQDALYRIRVGPFAKDSDARRAQETLLANKFEARLLKEAVTP